jgi:hypothetical protein
VSADSGRSRLPVGCGSYHEMSNARLIAIAVLYCGAAAFGQSSASPELVLRNGARLEVDALARRTTTIPLGADYSLYARVYWHVTNDEPLEFELFRDSPATWPRMKAGFEGLMNRYPKSKWNLNAYAYLACHANDALTYGVLRARIGQDVIQAAWASNYSTEVCDERLLGHT